VLASQELSHEEWMKMQQMQHMMHSGKAGGHSGNGMMMMEYGSAGPTMTKHDRQWK
jgi:hypothetical protein